MSTAPLHDRNHGNDERSRIKAVAAKRRVPIASGLDGDAHLAPVHQVPTVDRAFSSVETPRHRHH